MNSQNSQDYRRRILDVVDAELPHDDVLYHTRGQIRAPRLDGGPARDVAQSLRLAAVLVPVIDYQSELHILLTRRADHLDKHSGQVAFPGGKVEDTDVSPIDAALREAYEEVGLHADFIDVQGVLKTYETGTGFRILPVVALVRPGFTLKIDKNEVASVFEIPARLALNPEKYTLEHGEWEGRRRSYYSLQYDGYNIWGATANMLRHMGQKIRAAGGAPIQ